MEVLTYWTLLKNQSKNAIFLNKYCVFILVLTYNSNICAQIIRVAPSSSLFLIFFWLLHRHKCWFLPVKRWKQRAGSHPEPVLPEKVHFAIELPVPGEALLGQVAAALAALDALGVPGSVQHVEEEPVQDGPLAPGTVDHHVSGLQDAECRPSAARTRVYAEQRLGSGRGFCCPGEKWRQSPV